MDLQVIVIITIAAALLFDFINGFHDAANSIATVVSTRVLSPRVAVLWAGFFNFAAFAIFGVLVARASDLLVPRAHRRLRRRGVDLVGAESRDRGGHHQDRPVHRALAAHR